ncbi:hypothetical protein P9112_006987 [Eukaryota sp. TZLM1-RC]
MYLLELLMNQKLSQQMSQPSHPSSLDRPSSSSLNQQGCCASVHRPLSQGTGVKFICNNSEHYLLLTYSGEVYGLGCNNKGQVLYNGPQMIGSIPIKLPLNNITSISAGFNHSLALSSEGKLYGWGCNEDNQINMSDNHSLPLSLIEIPYNIKEIYLAFECSFALTQEGQVIKWGGGKSFEFIEELNNIDFVCADGDYADCFVAVDDSNTFFFFNNGEIVQLQITQYLIPRKLLNNSIVLTCLFLLIVDINGDIWKFGTSDNFFNNKPTKVPGLSNIVSVSGYGSFFAAINNNGNVFVWVESKTSSDEHQNESILIEPLVNVEGISVGREFLFAYNKNTVLAWHRNTEGQLGTGDLMERAQPLKVFGSEILGSFLHSKQALNRMFSRLIKLVYWEYLNYLANLIGNHPYVKARFYTKCSVSKRVAKLAKAVLNDHPIQKRLLLNDPTSLGLDQSFSDLQLRLSTAYNGPKVFNTRIKKLDVYYDDVDDGLQLLSFFPNVEVVKLGGRSMSAFSLTLANLSNLKCLELDYYFNIKQLPTSLVKLALSHGNNDVTDLSYLTSLKDLAINKGVSKRTLEGQIPLPQSIVRLEIRLYSCVNVEIQLPNLKELIINEAIPTNITEENFPSLKFIQLIRPNEENLLNSSLSPTNLANIGLIKSVHLTKNEYLVELSCFPWWIQSHIFCGTNFGGVDFHKSSYLCNAAFIGGGKNFIYEFVNRFPEKIHLIENCGSSYLISLQQEIETLSPNIWAKCFPSDIVELPSRSLLSLPLTFAKLQKKILKVLENLDYIVRLSLAKEKNLVFANFLIDLEDSSSSCLISQIPNILGLLLNDHQWTTAMRMRCFLWPCSFPNDLICRCKSVVTLSHILNCKYFITYRSIVHDSVRDQLYAMCKCFNIEAFIEPLVRKLSSDQTDDSFGKRRADLVAPGIDGVLNVVDIVSVDVCKNSAARLVYSADSSLSNAEKKKIKKYEEPLAQLGRVEHVKYQFVPFAISLFGNIGPSGLHFFENFKKVLLNRSGKTMNSTFWINRIVFCIFKSIPTMISKALLAIGVEYERNAVSRFSNSDACLEDIEY